VLGVKQFHLLKPVKPWPPFSRQINTMNTIRFFDIFIITAKQGYHDNGSILIFFFHSMNMISLSYAAPTSSALRTRQPTIEQQYLTESNVSATPPTGIVLSPPACFALRLCLPDTLISRAKTAEPTEMPFATRTRGVVGSKTIY